MRVCFALFALAIALPAYAGNDSMATVPAGKWMRCLHCAGKNDQVEIQLSAFRIDVDEVTQRQYAECVKAKRCAPAKVKAKGDVALAEPVRGVSWADADNYCKFVDKRLPTMAEWMRAAFPQVKGDDGNAPRIGTREPCKALLIGGYGGKRCPGAQVDGPTQVSVAVLSAGQAAGIYDRVHVGDASSPEIFDLYGNVAEWVADWDSLPGNAEYYFKPTTRKDPSGPATGREKLIVGGSFAALDGSTADAMRSARPTDRPTDVGIRCAASAP